MDPQPHPFRPPRPRAGARTAGQWSATVVAVAAAWMMLAGPGTSRAAAAAAPVPDFQLRDANSNSPRFGKTVSPRDYRLQISAYYFGAAG